MCNEITYPLLNFNGWTVEIKEWISNSIPHFTMDVITYAFRDLSSAMLVKRAIGICCRLTTQLKGYGLRLHRWSFPNMKCHITTHRFRCSHINPSHGIPIMWRFINVKLHQVSTKVPLKYCFPNGQLSNRGFDGFHFETQSKFKHNFDYINVCLGVVLYLLLC